MKLAYVYCFILLVLSCKQDVKSTDSAQNDFDSIEKLQWLVGRWDHITEAEQSYERWIKVNDSTLKAHSFTIINEDTVFAERLTVRQHGDETFLTAVNNDQNDELPVRFKLISMDNGVFTFENPKHDFPTRISYANPVKDSIHAWIEGTVEGEIKTIDFLFKRE